MIADYRAKIPFVAKWEGGVANRPLTEDPGGLTNRGITWDTWAALSQRLFGFAATMQNFLGMSDQQWERVFKWFWDVATWGNKVESQAISEWLHESYWASGTIFPCQWAVNAYFEKKNNPRRVAVDGVSGPQTILAINDIIREGGEKELNDLMFQMQERWYRTRFNFAANPGWLNRNNELYFITKKKLALKTR